MKKLFVFAVVALAIMSFGTHIGFAHAQNTPANTMSNAALEQELQVMKATLANLQMKAGQVPQGDSGAPTGYTGSSVTPSAPTASTGLSASDRATLSSALGSLVAALSSFNATLVAHPQAITSHEAAIASVLKGMQSTLVAMNSAVRNGTGSGSVSAPIAEATPSNTGVGTGIAQAQPSVTPAAPTPIVSNQPATQPSTGSLAPTAAPAGTNDQQTAQVSNTGGFVVSHWPTITIIVLVALILLILFWPSKGSDNEEHGSTRTAAKPQAPNRPLSTPISQSSHNETAPAATPVATIVSASAAKVTVIRPQQNQQQKKPA